jgi:diguanylate cyclase (GGDEF)-like protein
MAQLSPGGTAPLAVLLVEGSPIARQSLGRLISAHGSEVIGTADAGEAWARLGDRDVDVVVADWPTPGGPAIELLRRIRAREASGAPYTAFVLLASPSAREGLPDAFAAGADGWLTKPVDPPDVDAAVAAAARIARLERRAARAEDEVRRQAELLREEVRRDPLTRLGNRMRLDEDLRRYRGSAQRYGHRVGAVLLGVDQLRRYHDTLGMTAADDLLRRVAKAVRDGLRDGDAAYRFSDDTVLILLPEQGEDGAVVVAERARSAVASLRIPHPRSDAADMVTLSAGVADLQGAGRDAIDDWLRRAAGALEAARAAGGNRVVRGGHTRVPGSNDGGDA